MRSISDKKNKRKEKPHTEYSLNYFRKKSMSFMRKCGKNVGKPDRPQVAIYNDSCALHAG
jgi:hypothetical protein